MDEWFKLLVEIETHLYATIGVLEEQNKMCAETAIKILPNSATNTLRTMEKTRRS